MGVPSVTGAYLLASLPLMTVFGVSMWSAVGSTGRYFAHPSIAASTFGVLIGAPLLLHTVPLMCYWLYPDWFPEHETICQLCCCPGAKNQYGDAPKSNLLYSHALYSI